MLYRRLATLVAILHALVALFFLIGVVAVKLQPWLVLIHIPLVLWVCAAFIMGWDCPLTTLENSLRLAAGQREYQGSCIYHYLCPSTGFEQPAKAAGRKEEIYLGAFLTVVQLVLYVGLFHKDLVG